ncbi:MAG: Glucose-1-phosphate thymidylyltransferase 1 [Chloroflexi bacterium ADurb.Bin180]|jgi:glucose-1-phosphate thymidylyltransferase|nr:MAG: Glucose-1-phosphate thymidylyltransferase 1 [Chloroflexi bacterium ADurb.Bin180]HOU23536.1 glucose-1-phosphate thymidylyltransferase [Anaerolineae bacterium]HQJ52048.1 glucose-1-phosphate thymidylyltransferase [Anaerolineae bacterium]
MKGLILSGGKGTRLYPLTYTCAKQLVPVANKPVLFRVIEAIKEAGISEIGIVVGDTAPDIREAVGDGSRWEVAIRYIPQEAPLGLAHAVKISQDFLGDDRFVMFLGDNVIQGGISGLIRQFESSDANSQIVLTRVANPQQYGVAVLKNGQIVRLVEKPRDPPSDLALVGIYMFDHNVFEAVNGIRPSWRGELEITDAIQYLVDHGRKVNPYVHTGWWIDTGAPGDMLDANRLVLDELEPKVEGYVDKASKLIGKVTVQKGAEIIDSVIRGPAIIGEETRIVNSFVGPFTSIYHHCLVEKSEIEHSMVLEHSRLVDIPQRVENSLIGRNVEVTRSPLLPKAYKMVLGDNSRVGLL